MKPRRILNAIFALYSLILLSPLYLIVSLLIVIESRGSPLFFHKRIGRNGVVFNVIKFRTMFKNSDSLGSLTIGSRDPRVTRVGYYLRKYKIDEFPQMINVLVGNMSLVGPRPEVQEYVELYTEKQKKIILSVLPGVTDFASIVYSDENDELSNSSDPIHYYKHHIIKQKIELNMLYIEEITFLKDIKIILITLGIIFAPMKRDYFLRILFSGEKVFPAKSEL